MKQGLIPQKEVARRGDEIADPHPNRHRPDAGSLKLSAAERVPLSPVWDQQRVFVEEGVLQPGRCQDQLLQQGCKWLLRRCLGNHGKGK